MAQLLDLLARQPDLREPTEFKEPCQHCSILLIGLLLRLSDNGEAVCINNDYLRHPVLDLAAEVEGVSRGFYRKLVTATQVPLEARKPLGIEDEGFRANLIILRQEANDKVGLVQVNA
jgi:hypothetical protein